MDLGNWGGVRVVSSLLMFYMTLLFSLFPSFFVRGFCALKTVKRGRFLSPGPRFFNLGVFHRAALALSNGGIGWLDTPKTMLVCFISS